MRGALLAWASPCTKPGFRAVFPRPLPKVCETPAWVALLILVQRAVWVYKVINVHGVSALLCFQTQIVSSCHSGVGSTKILGGEQLEQSLLFFG